MVALGCNTKENVCYLNPCFVCNKGHNEREICQSQNESGLV